MAGRCFCEESPDIAEGRLALGPGPQNARMYQPFEVLGRPLF